MNHVGANSTLFAMRWLAPEVLQTSLMDCGPAALQSVLLGLGANVSYEQLRDRTGAGADGSSIADLAAAALAVLLMGRSGARRT